jgi:hypothetical protein
MVTLEEHLRAALAFSHACSRSLTAALELAGVDPSSDEQIQTALERVSWYRSPVPSAKDANDWDPRRVNGGEASHRR